MPKTTLIKVIADLEEGDMYSEQVKVYEQLVADQDKKIVYQENMLMECSLRDSINLELLNQCSSINNATNNIVTQTNKKLKKKKTENFFLKVGLIVVTSLFIIK